MSLPNKPWADGDTFTNEETGVKYTFDGEKWLAGGGAEADDATLALINEVDRTSQMRDEALDAKIDQESNLNTVAHIKFEDQILRCYAWSQGDNESLERQLTKVDEGLQAQIDDLPTREYVDNQIDDLPTTEYVDDGDRHLQGEIDQIALALETLLVQREHGQWKYIGFIGDNMPRNAGEFALASDDLSSSQNVITLNNIDLEGTTHGFTDVEVGDYLEIVDLDEPANYVLFTVKSAPTGTGITEVNVELKDKGQNFLIGETCEVRFFQVNEQDLQLDDLDARYLRKTGGNLTGGINMGTNPIMSVQYLGMTGAKCIQEAQTTQIKFDGKVTIAKAGTNKDGFVLKGATADGADKDLLSVYHNESGTDAVNYKGKQDSATNLATVGYVDTAVGNTSAKQMFTTSVFGHSSNNVNLDQGYWHFLQSDLQTPTVVGSGARAIVYKINNVDWWKGKVELTGFGYVVVSSAKTGEAYFAGNVIAGDLNALNEKGEVVLNLPMEARQYGMGTATLGETQRIEFINVFREL